MAEEKGIYQSRKRILNMERIFLSNNLRKAFSTHKKEIEEQLDVEIEIKGKYVFIIEKKDGYSRYVAEKVLAAIDMGFNIETALMLTNQNFVFEIIDIRKTIKPIKYKSAIGRVIGKKGRALKNLMKLTDCEIVLKENLVGVIGESAAVSLAVHALNSLIRGAPHSHVYQFLEENKGKVYESEDIE